MHIFICAYNSEFFILASIDIPGIGTVQADNFASEQTLNRLVDAVNNSASDQRTGFRGIFNQLRGETAAATAAIGQLGSAAGNTAQANNQTGQAVRGLGQSASGVTAAFSSYARTIQSINIDEPAQGIGAALTKLGESVQEKGSIAAGALGTVLGGPLVGAIKAATTYLAGTALSGLGIALGDLDKMSGEFRKAQANGAQFGQSMLNFRNFAHNAGLTMEQFNNVIAKSRDAMSQFGGLTTEGANMFSLANATAIREYGSAYQAMGMSFEQIGSTTAEYLGMIAEATPALGTNAMSMQEVTRSAFALNVQQKALATINGTTLEQEKEKMRMQRKDAQMNAILMGMSVKEREAVQALSAQFPQATQFIKEFVAFGAPVTKEGNLQAAMMGTLTTEIGNTINAVKGGADLQPSLETLKNVAASSGAIIAETQNMADLVKLGVAGSTNSFVQMAEKNFNAQFELMNKATNSVIDNTLAELEPNLMGFKMAVDPARDAVIQFRTALQTSTTGISAIIESLYRPGEDPRDESNLGVILESLGNTVTAAAQGIQAAAVQIGESTAVTGTAAPPSNIVTATTAGRLTQTDGGISDSITRTVLGENLGGQISDAMGDVMGEIGTTLTGMKGIAEKTQIQTTNLVEEVRKLRQSNDRLVTATQNNASN